MAKLSTSATLSTLSTPAPATLATVATAAPVSAEPGSAAERLLGDAMAAGASDLHLDPGPGGWRVRLRVDGRFVDRPSIDRREGQQLLGRLKVMAELMVYRSDVPQEGRIALAGGREGRLALIPTLQGEKATLRFFDPESRLETLDALRLPAPALDWLRGKLASPGGLLLVVGPSGSGKTTTLYASLGEVVRTRGAFSQVVTVEDPVERFLPGCVQVQVDPTRELDFAGALKFLLRQDPEVILIGEIRDAETARIAVRAAMTGHLVLSSLHCSRASEARPRLLEMGAERYTVDLALAGVLAQRLLRIPCAACHGAGCAECLETGYRGRTAVAEVLEPSREKPLRSLTEEAEALLASGSTTRAEVERVLGGIL